MRTLRVLLEKEFRQFFRNPFLPKMVVIFPMMVMLVIPWITTLDVKNISVSIIDYDHSAASRRLITKLNASDNFNVKEISESYASSLERLEDGEVDVIVSIPDDFEKSIASGSPKRVSIAANGVNALKGNLGTQYTVQVVMQTMMELRGEQGLPAQADLITVQNRYNPTLEYRFYMIPALMIMVLIMICGFLPALNLVGEKEKGTIEQMNVTPVGRFTFTLAKLIPYWLIGFLVLTVVMIVAKIAYGLTPVGSFGAIYLAALLFILTMSGIGLTISNLSSTMQQAMFVMFFFVMIFVLLSGLITPIESMPAPAQRVTQFLPPRYFIEVMRSVYLKGTTIAELARNYICLAAFATVFNTLAAITYKKQA